ncbi:hypothetical protein PM082_023206 [Marasmius tenuissimus]|nr:hypothetical protein PM082_023206 [Marasmius tenuissimus]
MNEGHVSKEHAWNSSDLFTSGGRLGQKGNLFVTGAAGVGKTAIAMTVAEACEEEDALVSSFFFFRSDPKRNNPKALVLTIAHDILSTIPSVRPLIEERVLKRPRILEARLEDQFRELVLNPILRSNSMEPPSSPLVPTIVILDGLNECGDERTQLRILNIIRDAAQHAPHFPLRFLICSRREAWIKEVFDTKRFRTLSKVILVGEASEDIIKYCRHHFREIITNPKYKQVRFPKSWPAEQVLRTLVDRSCSQFVYVATVIKFITLAGNHPVNKLRLILDNSPTNRPGGSPFPELDVLYHTILEATSEPEEVHAILVAILVLRDYLSPTPAHIELLLGLSSGQVDLTLRGMHSVLRIHSWADAIQLHHTSFRDYLLDGNPSRNFHVDLVSQKHLIVQQWLQQLTTSKIREYRYELTIHSLLLDYL